uniref:Uncharacterized protein n=1 Tax=Tanacetum cinerariifolium TaxID=118510 RepID=A0A699GYF4_TANCI|nr:hypothetical protein [Tanacetum cinerariifolium]
MEEYIELHAEKAQRRGQTFNWETATYDMTGLPPRSKRHLWLRYEVEGYTKEIVRDYKQRLATIFSRQVNRVYILDFVGLTEEIRKALTDRLMMVYTEAEGQVLFTSDTWRRLFKIQGPLVREFMLEFFSTCIIDDTKIGLDSTDTLCYQRWLEMDLRHTGDPLRRICIDSSRCVFQVGVRNLRRHVEGRKYGDRLSGGHFIRRLSEHFRLITKKVIRGMTVVVGELKMIDMDELVAATGASEDVKGAHAKRMARLEEEVHGLRDSLNEQREVMDAMARDFSWFTIWAASGILQLLDLSGSTYMRYYETHVPYQRRRDRRRIDDANTSTTPLDEDQPDL